MDKKHRGSIWWITILIAGLLLLLCSGMILRGISSIAQLFRTFLLGIMIAFVLNQPSKLIQNALTKKANWREKPAKVVGILGAYLFIFALLAAVIGIVIPQMIDSVRTFALNMDAYLNNLQQELDRITIPLGVQRIDLSNLIDLAHAGLGKMDAAVVPHILSVTGTMLQALGTLAISIAFLSICWRAKNGFYHRETACCAHICRNRPTNRRTALCVSLWTASAII